MHRDLDQQDASSPIRHARVCIVGGGIAGLLLAHRLLERGVTEIALVEAGGLEPEERSQELYAAEMAAEQHTGTTEGRFRTFGGSSTRWGGQLLPYTEDIFSPPAHVPSDGWPIDDRELQPYYEEVQRLAGTDLLPFDAELLPALGLPAVEFGPGFRLRYSKWIPFARRNLGQTLGPALLRDPRITVWTHANAAGLLALEGDAGRIGSVRVLDYRGREFRFTADHFVLATGTIESSRLMLLSPGVPDSHGQVGLGFHDHVSFAAATFAGEGRARLLERLGPFLVGGLQGTLHTCKLEASPALRAEHRLLAVMAHVTVEEPEGSGIAAVKALLQSVQRGRARQALGEQLGPVVRGVPELLRGLWAVRILKRRPVSAAAKVQLRIDVEQIASAGNRIRLSAERDALGLPRAVVDWRVSDAERDAVVRFAALVRAELERLGMAPASWSPELQAGRPRLEDTYHPMGGLRMGTDPAASVIDPELRVHGLRNLYVASCAVYPAGGSSNPTFTLMAMSLHLADRLAGCDLTPVLKA